MSQKKRSFEPKPIQDVLHQITEQRNLAKGLTQGKTSVGSNCWK